VQSNALILLVSPAALTSNFTLQVPDVTDPAGMIGGIRTKGSASFTGLASPAWQIAGLRLASSASRAACSCGARLKCDLRCAVTLGPVAQAVSAAQTNTINKYEKTLTA